MDRDERIKWWLKNDPENLRGGGKSGQDASVSVTDTVPWFDSCLPLPFWSPLYFSVNTLVFLFV